MTFFALVSFYLRRHRVAFFAAPAIVFAHQVVYLWLYQFWRANASLGYLVVQALPNPVRQAFGMPFEDLSDARTFQALYYLRPELRALTLLFGVTVATGVIAGEVGRGTGDVLFSHPLRRRTAVLAGVAAVALHLLLFGAVMLLGYAAGTALFDMGSRQPALAELVPGTALAMLATFTITLASFLVGSLCGNRPQAVGWSLGVILLPLFLELCGVFASGVDVVARFFPEHWYRPHRLLAAPAGAAAGECVWRLGAICAVLLAASVTAAERRDLSGS
ncbi:MAG: hypothetical protein ACREID_03390 [Planctomycetota bacterium]